MTQESDDRDPERIVALDAASPAEALSEFPCVVLLGEPGMGKTWVLGDLGVGVPAGDVVEAFDLGSGEAREIEEFFRLDVLPAVEHLGESGTLHLHFDGVDESPLSVKRLVAALRSGLHKLLRTISIERVRLCFACRPVGWPAALERELEALMPSPGAGVQRRWLLPLRPQDVRSAALAKLGDEADAFLAEVESRGFNPLVARPIGQNLMLRLWARDHALPATRREVYERGLMRMLEEARMSYEDREPPPAEDSYRIAMVVAGLMLLGNRTSIWAGPTGEETPLSLKKSDVVDVLGLIDPDGVVDHPRGLDAMMSIAPLGGGQHAGQWRFAHRTFAEFLAAQWLATAGASSETQIRSLTTASPDGSEQRVVPQLAGVAAWSADFDTEVFEGLLRCEPDLVLQTDLAACAAELRAKVVDALLVLVSEKKRVDEWEWEQRLGELEHDGLADQLRPWIEDHGADFFARRTAIRIARSCEVGGLEDAMSGVLDEPAAGNLQALAASALIDAYRRDERWGEIRALAKRTATVDDDDEILGAVVRALWPGHLEIPGLSELCRAPKRRMFFGRYYLFLTRELVDGLREDQLVEAVPWLASVAASMKRDSHFFDEVWPKLMSRVMRAEYLSERVVAGALVNPIFDHHRELGHGGYAEAAADALAQATAAHQLAAVDRCVERWSERPGLAWTIALDLRIPDAFGYAMTIAQRRAGTEGEQSAYTLASRLGDRGVVADVARMLVAAGHSEVAAGAFASLKELGDKAEEIVAAIRRKREPDRPLRPVDPPLSPAPAERVASRLALVEQGKVEFFPDLVFAQLPLASDATRATATVPPSIEQTPGWQAAAPATRNRIGNVALIWLRQGDPVEDEWRGTSRLAGAATAGELAVTHLHDHHPQLYRQLEPEHRSRWALAILTRRSSIDREGLAIEPLRDSVQADPASFADRLGKHLGREHSPSVELRRLEQAWAPELSVLMRRLIADAAQEESKADHVEDYASAWIAHRGPDDGFVVEDDDRFATPTRAALFSAHLRADSEECWDRVWPALETDDELATATFYRVARGQWGLSTFAASMTSPLHMAMLVERLTALFDPSEDPTYDRAHVISERESVADLRNGTLKHLASLGTREAVEALLGLQARNVDSSGRMGLRGLVDQAVQKALAFEWTPLPLKALVGLVARGRKGVVYLSSRFESPLRAPTKARLEEDYAVIVTEGLARTSSVLGSMDKDIAQVDVVVQMLEWSTGLGNRQQMGGSYVEQEQFIARVRRIGLLVGVLEDDSHVPEDLDWYLQELEAGEIYLAKKDVAELIDAIKASVDRELNGAKSGA